MQPFPCVIVCKTRIFEPVSEDMFGCVVRLIGIREFSCGFTELSFILTSLQVQFSFGQAHYLAHTLGKKKDPLPEHNFG